MASEHPPTSHAATRHGGDSAEARAIRAGLELAFGDLPPAAPTPHKGPERVGPYRILREIGSGGMGVVYEAEQLNPRRLVALKVMRAATLQDDLQVRMFHREIEALARLTHPAIAGVYDAGETDDGQHFFAMELIEGRPLTEYAQLSRLTLTDRLHLFARVCEAIQYAHQRGVIHRDLKPANILVDDDGKPHVLDFGLARFLDHHMDVTRSLPQGQVLLGTLPYMSPEQTRSEGQDLDIRTDVYSLGVILYEMLTGQYPYEVTGQLAEVLRNIAEAQPARPSTIQRRINNEIETICLRALAKDRRRRYPSAEALGEDVRRYLQGLPIEAKRDSALYVLRKMATRHSFETLILATLIISLVSFAVISFNFYRREQQAVTTLQDVNVEVRARNANLAQAYTEATRTLRAQTLGWFLTEWHAGRLDRARSIQATTAAGSAEQAVMSFLLDDETSFEALLNALPPKDHALAYLAAGERAIKNGRQDQAKGYFQAGRDAARGGWLAEALAARCQAMTNETQSHAE